MFMNNTETKKNIQILFSCFTTRYQHDYALNTQKQKKNIQILFSSSGKSAGTMSPQASQ